jgi:hypothetical protein
MSYGWDPFLDFGGYWWGRPSIATSVVDQTLVLQLNTSHHESIGEWESCSYRQHRLNRDDPSTSQDELPLCNYDLVTEFDVDNNEDQSSDQENERAIACHYYVGNVRCERSTDVEDFECSGQVLDCQGTYSQSERTLLDEESCQEVDVNTDEASIRQDEIWSCYTHTRNRYWQSTHFQPIHFHNPDQPQLGELIERPEHEQTRGVLVQDDQLFYSYSIPVVVENDELSYIRHFTRALSFTEQGTQIGNAINLPGRLILKKENQLITQDLTWGSINSEASVNLLQLNSNQTRARLINRHLFSQQRIKSLHLDNQDHVVITHRQQHDWSRSYYFRDSNTPQLDQLSIFSLDTLDLEGQSESDRWANLVDVHNGKAVFQVGGGVLLMDIEDPSDIQPQAFFPLRSWGSRLQIDGDTLYATAGRFGIYSLSLNSYNLLPPPL